MTALMPSDGRILVVAVDHPLYSWPCPGLEDRPGLLAAVVEGGADAVIASYGTVRDHKPSFGEAAAILKLDVTTLTMGGTYPVSEYRLAWTVDDAVRLGAEAVLTFVQLGTDGELDALVAAGKVAAAADRQGLSYVCEIMPVESERFPSPAHPSAVAAACRTAAELGAHLVKTSMPDRPEAIAEAVGCGVPVIVAGGDRAADDDAFVRTIAGCVSAGAAGAAVGRNVWGAADSGAMTGRLADAVHGGRA